MATNLDPEGYCPASDHPRWNQSFYFNFYDPATKTGAFIRAGILENVKEANNWFVFFRDGRPLFNRLNMNLPYTDKRLVDGQFDDSPLTLRELRSVEDSVIKSLNAIYPGRISYPSARSDQRDQRGDQPMPRVAS